jgi:hypothetical protein
MAHIRSIHSWHARRCPMSPQPLRTAPPTFSPPPSNQSSPRCTSRVWPTIGSVGTRSAMGPGCGWMAQTLPTSTAPRATVGFFRMEIQSKCLGSILQRMHVPTCSGASCNLPSPRLFSWFPSSPAATTRASKTGLQSQQMVTASRMSMTCQLPRWRTCVSTTGRALQGMSVPLAQARRWVASIGNDGGHSASRTRRDIRRCTRSMCVCVLGGGGSLRMTSAPSLP